jgi:hypothetical protein
MKESTAKKIPGRLSTLQRLILRLAAQNEPRAITLEEARLRSEVEGLVEMRILGKVEIRGEDAWRLTDYGRSAVEALGIPFGTETAA